MIELRPHEIEAIESLMLHARAMAEQLKDTNYGHKLQAWSLIAEELLERSREGSRTFVNPREDVELKARL